MTNLMDKRVMVTGAARGIGLGIARRFLDAGAWVTACDIDTDALEGALGRRDRCTIQALDVRDEAAWTALQESWQGGLDFMVNNAGVLRPGFLLDAEAASVHLQIDVNLKGVVFGTQTAARIMRDRGSRGHIINISSLAGLAPVGGLSVYAASKFGVRGFSLSMAQELADYGIHLSVIAPDAVDTHMLEEQKDSAAAALTFSGGRILTVDDIVRAVFDEAIDKRRTEVWLPLGRGVTAYLAATFPRLASRLLGSLRNRGLRQQERYRKRR